MDSEASVGREVGVKKEEWGEAGGKGSLELFCSGRKDGNGEGAAGRSGSGVS